MAKKEEKKKSGAFKMPEDIKGVEFTTPRAIGAFLHLFEPHKATEDSKPKYSCTLLWDKKADLKEMRKHIDAAAAEVFGTDKTKWPKPSPTTGRGGLLLPWRDGNEKADFNGYEGRWYVSCQSGNKPIIVDRDKNKIEVESEIYAGILCHARVRAKVTEAGGNYFVTLYLQGFMKWDDGEPLSGGGCNVEEAFGHITDDEESSQTDEDTESSDDDDDFLS